MQAAQVDERSDSFGHDIIQISVGLSALSTASSWLNSLRSALQEGFDIEYEGPLSYLTDTAFHLC